MMCGVGWFGGWGASGLCLVLGLRPGCKIRGPNPILSTRSTTFTPLIILRLNPPDSLR